MLAPACRRLWVHAIAASAPHRFAAAPHRRRCFASIAAHSTAAAAAKQQSTASMEVVRLPALDDNYIWLLHEPRAGKTAVVDPAETGPVLKALQERGWSLDTVLNTHHHGDHTGGNLALKERFPGLTIVGPRADAKRIPGIDVQRGHISFYIPAASALFCGDTLFALGCGRLFEGDPPTMWASLSKLAALPRDTKVYCAHEYTASNARFAASVNPSNAALAARKAAVDAARAKGEPTVPSLLGEELDTNPFLRPFDPEIREKAGAPAGAGDAAAFGAVRAAKDSFRG